MPSLPADLRDALRSLRARPAFTITLVLTLGLGIGATTTVYSFVYALLFRPYPYHAPDQLVRVQTVYTKEGGARRGTSLLDLEDYRRRGGRIAGIGAYTTFTTRLLSDQTTTAITAAQLNPEALSLLGVSPVLGRLLLPEEDRVGGDVYKAVIGYDVWQTHFGADPAIVGKPLRTDRQMYTIVGVMPPGFAFPDRVNAWMPMESYYASLGPNDSRRVKWRGARWYATIARLAPNVGIREAEDELNAVAASLEREYPKDNDGVRVALTPLREFEMGAVRPYLLVCLAGVAFVLLICCANVANLLLVRAAVRQREIAVKAALGAGAGRIARGIVCESLLLGALGIVVGVAFGVAGVRGLLALIPADLPAWMQIEVDAPVLVVAAAAGLLTSLLFSLVPVFTAPRVVLTDVLREGSRGATRSRMRASLVAAEVALSVVLLVGAGLLMKTFSNLQKRDPGFRSDGLVVARTVLWAPGRRSEAAAALAGIHNRVLDGLRALPGVQSVAVTNSLPYSGTTDRLQADIFIKGRDQNESKTLAPINGADVGPEYFATMRIPLVRGRLFEPTDTPESEPVILISERAARMFWRDQDPIGHYISWGQPKEDNPWTRVVGVVGNVKQHAAEGDVGIELYYPITQWPVATSYYVARTSIDPDSLLDTVRRTILSVETRAAVTSVKTMERTMAESLWQRRLWGVLFSAFAGLALTLAAVGLYGVISYAVAQRTREMGVRLALGAAPAEVRRLIVGEGMRVCAAGGLIGLVASLALGRLGSTLLVDVTPYDGPTYALVVMTVILASLTACWIPALRASRVDPTTALRVE